MFIYRTAKDGGSMVKIIKTWFQCALCPRETDIGYEVEYQEKKIIICEECLRKIKEKEKIKVPESVLA
jgi:DNA-directed RNA polymerase subunit RPC12/RpoP